MIRTTIKQVMAIAMFLISFANSGCARHAGNMESADTLTNEAERGIASEEYQRQYRQTVEFMKLYELGRGYSGDRASAYIRQGYVLGLIALQNQERCELSEPYLLNAFLVDVDTTNFRFVTITWLARDNAIPSFEVIGRGGQVVGVFEGISDYKEPIGGYPETWIRMMLFRPVLNGEAEGEGMLAYPPLRMDISSLQEIDAIGFKTEGCSRYVRAFMGAGVGVDGKGVKPTAEGKGFNEDIWHMPDAFGEDPFGDTKER